MAGFVWHPQVFQNVFRDLTSKQHLNHYDLDNGIKERHQVWVSQQAGAQWVEKSTEVTNRGSEWQKEHGAFAHPFCMWIRDLRQFCMCFNNIVGWLCLEIQEISGAKLTSVDVLSILVWVGRKPDQQGICLLLSPPFSVMSDKVCRYDTTWSCPCPVLHKGGKT